MLCLLLISHTLQGSHPQRTRYSCRVRDREKPVKDEGIWDRTDKNTTKTTQRSSVDPSLRRTFLIPLVKSLPRMKHLVVFFLQNLLPGVDAWLQIDFNLCYASSLPFCENINLKGLNLVSHVILTPFSQRFSRLSCLRKLEVSSMKKTRRRHANRI